jgi:predicted Zn-dependent protease with MMP-like domain
MFEQLVADALDRIPERFASEVDNVAFLVDDSGAHPELLGLYQGVPLTRRAHGVSGSTPDRITLFQRSIERASATLEELAALVHEVVVHELGHYFGMEDDRLRELGW